MTILLSRGLAKEYHDDYAGALQLYEAMDSDQRLSRWQDGREVLYYFAGRVASKLRQLDKAEAFFTSATAKRNDYVNAYIGLGNAKYERAQLWLLANDNIDSSTIALCSAAVFTNTQTALKAEQLPVSMRAAITTTTQAIGYYQQAVTATKTFEWAPAGPIARYMLANGQRLRGELYWVGDQLAAAEADLQAAQQALQSNFDTLASSQEPGYLAYSWYSLGQVQRTLAQIARVKGANDQATAGFQAAQASFQRCQTFKDQPDIGGDTRVQAQAACYCGVWQQKVQAEEQQIPPEEKGTIG
jgi:tetratricopeptide (TPR) repeat protein